MSLREFGVLLGLGAIWGASFMFIKVGGEEMGPFFLVEMRLALAGVVLLVVASRRKGALGLIAQNWRPLLLLGLINCAIPYTLITWGENYIPSGLAAIYNACAPLWAAVLGLLFGIGERLAAARFAGVLVGLAGVALVVSGDLAGGESSWLQLAGQLAVLLAALSYAFAGIYGRHAARGLPSIVPATGQLVFGALMLLPLAALQVPATTPSAMALGAVATLAILGTAVASLLYFWLLAHVGATRTLLVTYLLPGFALVWGALFLKEPVMLTAVVGLALVLLGIALTSGQAAPLYGRVRAAFSNDG